MNRRQLAKVGLLVLLVVAPIEALSCAAGRLLAAQGWLYRHPGTEGYAAYRARRDPVLGWPAPDQVGRGEMDAAGSRSVPAFPDPERPNCVALYGDSFTWGDEVGPEDAYGNVLAERLGCRVANYGVPGYGSDQAFLRYRDRVGDGAPVVVLGHFSENVIRNVNQYRGFISRGDFGLKPRFVAEPGGGLRLVPLPDLTEAEFAEIHLRPELLGHDFFQPGGAAGISNLEFPFTLSVLGIARHYRVRSWFEAGPSYARFYHPDDSSRGLAVTSGILKAFEREARRRGQRPVVILIPDEKDLIALAETGALPYASLAAELTAAGIATPGVAERMQRELGDRDPCALYTRCGGAHFNPEGYALLAQIVFEWIEAGGLLDPEAQS
ncbi:MAG: hypothetical protein MJE66_19380 [Proteobacteria bacterium]|nr:hypothetical protein [Pseudomonadota bacterium]